MLVCAQWLADDYLVRQGYQLIDNGPDAARVAVRGTEAFRIDPACTCVDCPPLPVKTLEAA